MKKFYILWTYIGNYSDHPMEVQAHNATQARNLLLECFSEDFRKKAKVYVFDSPPVVSYDGRKENA